MTKSDAFFKLVQEAAKKQGCRFFMDAGEGREIQNDRIDGEDLSGWLIPFNKTDLFEPNWGKNTISDEWGEFFTFAIWEEHNGDITIKFKNDF